MLLAAYHGLGLIAEPAVRRLLLWRRARGKEHPQRWTERLGHPTRPRPNGVLIWVHAASVGEAVSALALVERILDEQPRSHALITSGTVSSARVIAARLPDRALHQFAPVDLPGVAARFLDHWRPDAALWIESELWPTLIGSIKARKVPMALVNGRMSQSSFRRWSRLPSMAALLLGAFRIVLAQSEADAARLRALGATQVASLGNLKSAAAPLPVDRVDFERMSRALAGARIWVAASTHPGEEEIVAEAHRTIRANDPGIVTILVPRHPDRADAIAAMLADRGVEAERRSRSGVLRPDALYLADTLGEMGLWFRLSRLVFIGGSLVPVGGHNPLEPALLGAALLHGPHMHNFAELDRDLIERGAARRVGGADDLAAYVIALLATPDDMARMGEAARRYAEAGAGVLDRVHDALAPLLAPTPRSAGTARAVAEVQEA